MHNTIKSFQDILLYFIRCLLCNILLDQYPSNIGSKVLINGYDLKHILLRSFILINKNEKNKILNLFYYLTLI